MNKKLTSDDVLKVVKTSGPIVPNKIKQILKQQDSTVIGAMLSELVRQKLVGITIAKLGGSPFYYDISKPHLLEGIIRHLNEKDRATVNLLKEKKVLIDKEQSPLTRVSLRNVKDFAYSFSIMINGEENLVWRYFLISEENARKIITSIFSPKEEKKVVKVIEEKPKTRTEENKGVTQVVEGLRKLIEEKLHTGVAEKKEKGKEDIALDVREEKKIKITEKIEKRELTQIDSWTSEVFSLLKNKDVDIISNKIIRKNQEIELLLDVPSGFSKIRMFCKAKNKKKINDKDLASALLQAQQHRLPCLFIAKGEVTKKAKQMLEGELKGLTLFEI